MPHGSSLHRLLFRARTPLSSYMEYRCSPINVAGLKMTASGVEDRRDTATWARSVNQVAITAPHLHL